MAFRITTRMANRSRTLRKGMTEPEIMLWSRLKTRGQGKPIFRRQYVFASMIFDFYCPAAKLAVEIDGSSHWTDEKRGLDERRDRWLASQGIEVLRVSAGAVYANLSDVADAVILKAESRIPALPFPRSGRGGPPAEERVVERARNTPDALRSTR